jgi:ribosomal protein L7/L12
MADIDILGLRNRLERLEAQVRTLSEHLGIPFDDGTNAVPPEVVELVRADKRMHAIKKYAELTGADLATAKDIVSAL